MKLTRYEQETIINFNEEESVASVYTHNRPLLRKLEKLAQDRPEDVRLHNTSHCGQAAEYHVPKAWLRIYPPRVAAPLTEEQKQERRARLMNAQNQ